jgi:predicted outer membrane repeat protein
MLDEDNGSLIGNISLREAVKYSPAGDTITFAPALSGQTIRLTLGQILVTKSLSIDGSALASRITLSGDKTGNGRTPDDSRVFWVDDVTLALDSLIFSDSANYSDSYGGGAIYSSGHSAKLTVNRCTFSGNCGFPEGGAIYFYGAYQSPETALTVRNSTFSGNSATQYGGAIYAFGILNVQYTTITANTATSGGGLCVHFNTPAVIDHGTITGNSGTTSHGGIYNLGSLTMQGTVLVANTAPASPNISGTYTGSNNFTAGNPLLAPLGDYGGHTLTMMPLPGSPCINGGQNGEASASDQRGFPRVFLSDIGAVEFQGNDIARIWKMDFDGDGSPYGIEVTLGTDLFAADPGNARNLSAPIVNASGHAILHFGGGPPPTGAGWVLRRSPI